MTVFADCIIHNGCIYTADAENRICQALAIKAGIILASGNEEIIRKYATAETKIIDLEGKTVIPGIVDAHLHPFWGGHQLVNCSFEYRALTVAEILQHVQDYLDQSPLTGEHDWFQGRAWLRSDMLPSGVDITCHDLDTLHTKRPVILFSNDCHTLVANSRALVVLGIHKDMPDPVDGKIGRFPDNELNGILEDAPAMRAYDSIPPLSLEENLAVARLIQQALNKEGITTVLDARVHKDSIALIKALKAEKTLSVRYCCAQEIMPENISSVTEAQAVIQKIAACFPDKLSRPDAAPDLMLRTVKFFVDGVIHPMKTAALLDPYFINNGTEIAPDWQLSQHYGDLYFSEELLEILVIECAHADLDIHLHTVGDRAIEVTLNAVEKMRTLFPLKDIRVVLAHNELVAPHQYQRFADLKVTAVLSFQWAGFSESVMVEEKKVIGNERFHNLAPAAKFIDAGARVAYGSDWPIDALNTWYNLQVAVTRIGDVSDHEPPFRLDTDRDLTVVEVLRAATIDAAYSVHMDRYIGSLEPGKFADLVILDQNPFIVEKDQLRQTRVLRTMVGGKIVYEQLN